MNKLQQIKWNIKRKLRDYKWFRKLMDKEKKVKLCPCHLEK